MDAGGNEVDQDPVSGATSQCQSSSSSPPSAETTEDLMPDERANEPSRAAACTLHALITPYRHALFSICSYAKYPVTHISPTRPDRPQYKYCIEQSVPLKVFNLLRISIYTQVFTLHHTRVFSSARRARVSQSFG